MILRQFCENLKYNGVSMSDLRTPYSPKNDNEPVFTYDPLKDKSHKISEFGKPKKRWKKVLSIFALIVAIATGVLAIYFYSHLSKISTNLFGGFGKLNGEADGRVNILLLGIGDPGHDGEQLSDTNMVISLNTKTNQVAMISIPRDLRVKIPGYDEAKINQANSDGFEAGGEQKGIELAKQTVTNTLGIPIHYYVKADFTGLKQVVDAVGGVDITVTDTLYDPEYPCDKNEYKMCGYKITPGNYHMDGTAALKYARCRKGTCGDDFGRALRQQQVLTATREKVMSSSTLTNPAKLNDLLNAVSNNIRTDLSINNLLRLNDISKKIDKNNIINVVFSTKDNGFLKEDPAGSSDLLPASGNFSDIQAFVRDVFKYGPIWAEEPTVAIENGTTTAGLASKLSDKIDKDGYPITVVSVGNALTRDYDKTVLIDYSKGKKPKTLEYLQNLLNVKAQSPDTTDSNDANVDFRIVTGADRVSSPSPTPSN